MCDYTRCVTVCDYTRTLCDRVHMCHNMLRITVCVQVRLNTVCDGVSVCDFTFFIFLHKSLSLLPPNLFTGSVSFTLGSHAFTYVSYSFLH